MGVIQDPWDRSKGLRLVYEHDCFLVVEKPAGMHSAPIRPGEENTALTRLLEHYPEIGSVPGIKSIEPGLLHRLDQETSGLLLVARTESSFHFLRQEMENERVLKKYLALCNPREPLLPPEGWEMESWRERLSRLEIDGLDLTVFSRFRAFGPGGRRVAVLPEGKKVSTKKRVTRRSYRTRILPERLSGNRIRCRVQMTRGFRHQIRVHLSASGLPIVGDGLYGDLEDPSDRMYLHAYSLELKHPETSRLIRIETRIPEGFG